MVIERQIKMYYAALSFMVICTYFLGNIQWKIGGKKTNIPLIFVIVVFAVMLGFRPDYFPDTHSYNEIYDAINFDTHYGFDPFGEVLTVEYGFFYFMYFCKWLGLSARICYSIYNLITIYIFLFAIDKLLRIEQVRENEIQINYLKLLSMFMSYFGIYYLGIAIREGLDIALCILAIYFIKKRRFLFALISFVIGFLTHRLMVVGVIVVLVYFWGNIQFNKKIYMIIWGICGAYLLLNSSVHIQNYISTLLLKYLPKFGLQMYMGYAEDYFMGSFAFSWTNFFVWIFVGILTWFYFQNDFHRSVLNLIYIGLLVSFALYTFKGSSRIYDFFTVFSIPIMYNTVQMLKTNKASIRRLKEMIIMGVGVGGLSLIYIIVYL